MENEFSFWLVAEQIKKKLKESIMIIVGAFIPAFYLSNIIIEKISEHLVPEELVRAYFNPCFIQGFSQGAANAAASATSGASGVAIPPTPLISTTPTEVVMVRIQIALLIALTVYLPFLAYWLFGAIKKRFELNITKRSLIPWLISAIFLFLLGFSITYYVVLPQAIKILTILTAEARVMPLFSLNEFMFFVVMSLIIFSISFEFPLVLTWLSMRGLVYQASLKERRRYVYVAIVFIAAIITADPTPVSQVLLSGPLIFLYELSIFIVGAVEKVRERTGK